MDESDIPIDIHTNKLMDWLISRRHVQRDWHSKVVIIREKINSAMKDMPENEKIMILLTGSYINYFHCQKLIEILKETEADSKNLFGHYSSQRMKDWLEIVKLYSKDNIYLAEAASLLLRNINYEIPALKKQVTKAINAKQEYDRKEMEYEKSAENHKKEFLASCKALGIKGENIKTELLQKAKNFSEINKKLAQDAKSLEEAVRYYQKTVKIILNSDSEDLKMLDYVLEQGDTSVYEWKHKKPPVSIEQIDMNVEEHKNEEVENDTIDFNTDIDLAADEDIDWGISTEDSEFNIAEERKAVKTEVIEDGNGVARGDEARTILGHPNTRNLLVNDVLELASFLKMRMNEMKSDSDGLLTSIYSESTQEYGNKEVRKMLDSVQSFLGGLRNSTAMHFLSITTNPRYVNLLTERLERKLRTVDKMLASRNFIRSQRKEVIQEKELIQPKIDVLIQKSKELQAQIEEDISKKYKGRPVNLIAGANLL